MTEEKNKVNVGDLIMLWKDRPHDQPELLCLVIKLLGRNKTDAVLWPVGEDFHTALLPKEQRVWPVKYIWDWKVG